MEKCRLSLEESMKKNYIEHMSRGVRYNQNSTICMTNTIGILFGFGTSFKKYKKNGLNKWMEYSSHLYS